MAVKYKVGIIGLGIMGRRMLDHMRRHAEFAPSALWDPSAAAIDLARATAPEVPVASSAEEVIAASDLVYLACPPEPRKAYALAAAAHGRAVFLEKPLGVDIAASTDLVAKLAAANTPAAVNFVQASGNALATICRDPDINDPAGIDIVVTYPAWPRAWQREADWLRLRAEGGFTREVISHFLFFSMRVLGPLDLVWARPTYPDDAELCETHMLARLENAAGVPISLLASVGGAQPDRQEMTIKGAGRSYRVAEFHLLSTSTGDAFTEIAPPPADPRAISLKGQLDEMAKAMRGEPNLLATPAEALHVQTLIEAMLADAN